MGRGALSKVRWRNDRIKQKKSRDKRQAQERAETRGAKPKGA